MLKTKNLWCQPCFRDSLERAGLLDLESLGRKEFEWFETPNKRRGGWSGVSRIVLKTKSDVSEPVFLKIQQNHFYRSWRNAFLKKLSYTREFHAIRQLQHITSCVPEIIMHAEWKQNGARMCVIMSKSLDEWQSLAHWLARRPGREDIYRVLTALADTLRPIHQASWAHFGLFQKHIFVRKGDEGDYKIKLIDFEKARKTILARQSVIEDLSRFLRHSKNLDDEVKIFFLQSYFQTQSFRPSHKQLIRKLRGAPKI